MEVAKQISEQLKQNKLFTAQELKQKLNDLIKIIKTTADKEFQLIEFYDNLIKLKNIEIQQLDVKQVGIHEMILKAASLVQQISLNNQPLKCLEEQQRLLLELHNTIITIAVMHDQMRQNRLRLITDMVEQVENVIGSELK
ncbi:Hypothetical_protein [Hexamita inflata]|uniref:Hypothetical_protein n=1 Tax=Hexamita inflata TaxID=28002 RepID=A0AA86N5C6_9EUKA|nr:Hypothetical protein HINF_LOCUS514 [Hexamita inflata]